MDRPRYHHSGRHRRRVLAPPQEPEIVYGAFVGRRLSELSDEDLNRFLSSDAKVQFKLATPTLLFKAGSYLDLSSYWFAKYELERRKPEARREASASLNVTTADSLDAIAMKLVEFGFRAASRKYHPDHGGSTETMQKINAARELARSRLKK